MEQTFFFTNQCTDFSDGVHFTTVYYNEYGDSFNSWNICLDIENHTFTKVYNNRGSNKILWMSPISRCTLPVRTI